MFLCVRFFIPQVISKFIDFVFKMEEIIEKEMSLAGVQIPFNSLMLGTEAKLFFRMGEFAGWVVEK